MSWLWLLLFWLELLSVMVSLWDLMLWVQALNMTWHGLLGVAWCAFRRPTSLEVRASMVKLTGLMDMVDNNFYMRGLALMPCLTPWGGVSDGRLIACDDTAQRWMVPSLMCPLSYRILPWRGRCSGCDSTMGSRLLGWRAWPG